VDGPWTELPGSPTTIDYEGTFNLETFDLSSYADIYIKFENVDRAEVWAGAGGAATNGEKGARPPGN
jgi:hypothetical protein